MAIKEFKANVSEKKSRKHMLYIFVICMLAVCAWVCFTVSASNSAEQKKYEVAAEEYYDKIDRVAAENNQYTNILENGEDEEYFEKVARELHGYCRPGEKVYHFPD